MDGISKRLIDKDGKVRCMSAQDFAKLTHKDKAELQMILNAKGETLEGYEEKVQRLSPKKITMPPIKWLN